MTMTTQEAAEYRRQLIEDGFCRILNVAPAELIAQARQVADRGMEMAKTGADRAELIQHTSVELWKLPALAPLMGLPAALEVLAALGYPRPRYYTGFCISKWPETGPALYWHQDGIYWDQAISYTDVPHQFFLMYYLVDTNRTNGCLRVIPGSHRKRHRLHALPPRDKEVVQRAEAEAGHPALSPDPDEMDVPVQAGDLVIGDSRLLHSAHPNRSRHRRTVIVLWFCPTYDRLPAGMQAAYARHQTRAAPYDSLASKPENWSDTQWAWVEPLLPDYSGDAEPLPQTRVPDERLP